MTEPIERPAELAETLDAWEAPRDDVIALDYQDPAAGATFSFGVVTAPVAEKESAGFDDEASRLSRVEAQLGNLLNELRRLQKSLQPGEDAGKLKSMGVGTGVSGIIMGVPVDPTTIPTTRSHTKRIQQPMAVTRMPMKGATGIHFTNIFLENTAVETVIMTRTLYSLPKGHAEALAKSLAEQLNDDVEIKVKGDAIQVTASNEDQKAIAHLVHLILQKGRAPVSTNSAGYYLDPDRR